MKTRERIPAEFLKRIPKTDIHLHLDGSLRLPTLIEIARKKKVKLPSYTEDGLHRLVFKDHYRDLPDYLAGFAYTVAAMQDAESIERIAYELAQDNLAEGVRYIEVRFAPQLHMRDGFSLEQVVRACCDGLDRAKREHNRSPAVKAGHDIPFDFGVILCALRFFHTGMSPYYSKLFDVMPYAPPKQVFAAASLELARATAHMVRDLGLPVVAFDLAGAEAGFPAGDHKAAFQQAHRAFIRKTVHAGEAYGPESIFQAMTDCYANRIGHGTWLFAADHVRDPSITDPEAYVQALAEYIAAQRIGIEVCLTSNAQTQTKLRDLRKHPLRQMLDHNLSVSICTDNRLVSNTSVTNELRIAIDRLHLSRRELRKVIVAGFKASFFPGTYTEKRTYVRRVLDRYDEVERDFFPPQT